MLAAPGAAGAHAFPDRSEPRVGHTLEVSPPTVRIWFDSSVEPAFSAIRVEDGTRRRVDKGDGRVSPTNRTLLEVSLPPLSPGRYEVHWSVVGRDGHRTEGSFFFRVK
jgi:methionine-rich copper-binding protein CopC